MTQDNVTAVRAFFEALNRGALDDAVAPLDPEVEFDWTRSRSPERGVYRGREEVKRLYERFIESWTECEFFETEIFESGDAVVRVGGFRGRGKGSGVATRASAAIVWGFRGGRAISAGMYQSKAEALEAVSPGARGNRELIPTTESEPRPGLEEGTPFKASDQWGTGLVLAGTLVDWVAVRRWMADQRAAAGAGARAGREGGGLVQTMGHHSAGDHRRGHRLCGLAMIAAPLLILAAMIIHTPHGADAASWLESAEAGRTRFYLAHLLFLATAVALVPVALGLADLVVERERTLARLGRGLALLGIAGLCVLVGMDLFLWQLVADPAMESRDALRAVERVTTSVGINAPIAVLLAGLPLGFALLALGLYRTHATRLWSALAIALAVPVTFGGLPLGWLAIVGAVVATAGMGSVGWPLLRGSAGSVSFTLARGSHRRSGEPVRGHAT